MAKKDAGSILINKGRYEFKDKVAHVVIHVPADIPVDAFARQYSKVFFRPDAKKDAS